MIDEMKIDKKDLISLYEGIIDSIWSKATAIIGEVTISSLMETALHETGLEYRFLQEIEILPTGMNMDKLKTHCANESFEDIKAGFEHFITNLFTIVASLTGNVVLQLLSPEVQKMKEQLKVEVPLPV
ncbi:MAG: hypothetical protein QME81_03420 [bacterium]|nr:hypothetical protein [bacterium]